MVLEMWCYTYYTYFTLWSKRIKYQNGLDSHISCVYISHMVLTNEESLSVRFFFFTIMCQKTNLEDCISGPIMDISVTMFADNISGTTGMND